MVTQYSGFSYFVLSITFARVVGGIGLSNIWPGCGLGFLRLAGLVLFAFGLLLWPSLPSGGDRLSVSLWLY